MRLFIRHPGIASLPLVGLVLTLTGCRRDEVQVYQAPKESGSAAVEASPRTPAASSKAAPPWKVPEGWVEKPDPSGMRQASYGITTADGRSAEISVVALGGSAGSPIDNVNRWRNQLQLPPIDAAQFANENKTVKIGSRASPLYEMSSDSAVLDGKFHARTIVSVLPVGDLTVFFKLTGEDALVQENRATFLKFLESVAAGEGNTTNATPANTASSPSPTAPPSPSSTQTPSTQTPIAPPPSTTAPAWEVPPGWTAGNPSPMRIGSFLVSGPDASKADISVIALGSQSGGVLANVNRWRGQVALPPLLADDLARESSIVPLAHGEATLVDMTGEQNPQGEARKTRILAAIVSKPDRTWFYKMTGDESLVAREKDNFIRFVKSVKY